MKLSPSFLNWAALGLLLVVLFNLPPAVEARLADGVKDALAPAAGGITRALAWVRGWFADGQALAADNQRLLAEIGQLQWEIRQLRSLDEENSELRRLLGLEARLHCRMIAAQVTSRAIGGWWQRARLDKGLAAGAARDCPVISAEGLVGRIVEVSARTSDVLLLVDPNSQVSARVARRDAFGIVRGQGVSWRGDPLCRMDFIVKEADILPGDEIVTSGLGGVYPPGLVIGYVERVYLDPSGLYQYADVVPVADLRLLGLVMIVSGEQPAADDGQRGRQR